VLLLLLLLPLLLLLLAVAGRLPKGQAEPEACLDRGRAHALLRSAVRAGYPPNPSSA